MCGLAGLLADGDATPAEVPEFGRNIVQLGEGMLAAVADLVDLHRYEEGSVALRLSPISLVDLAERIRSPLAPAAERKHIRLTLHVSTPEAAANLDSEVVLRIVGNLATNALKFSPVGSAVEIRLGHADHLFYMEVADQGPGISVADQKKLFTKFARLAARPTAGESSSGLGLAIVKRLIEAHGGKVSCESALGAGARFRVEIPAPAVLG